MKHMMFMLLGLVLVGCNQSDDASTSSQAASWPPFEENAVPDKYGRILDSEIEGLRYISGAHYGTTDAEGKFGYISGEDIQFYIGDIEVGARVAPGGTLTPYDLAGNNAGFGLNIARFLQTLDDDFDPTNGIQINEAVHHIAAGKTIDFLQSVWADSHELYIQNEELVSLIYELTSGTAAGSREMVFKHEAYDHFSLTLNDLIAELTIDINDLANSTTCDLSEQCIYVELETADISYCPDRGPFVAYSQKDIDESLYDSLVLQREKYILVNYLLGSEVHGHDNTSGLCIRGVLDYSVFCNASNRCELVE